MRILILVLAMSVTGCAMFKNMSAADVRADKYRYKSGAIDMSMAQIKKCTDKTLYSCGPASREGQLIIDPDNQDRGSLIVYGPGLSQINPYIIIDFVGNATSTNFEVYVLPSEIIWKKRVNEFLTRIESCGDCARLP